MAPPALPGRTLVVTAITTIAVSAAFGDEPVTKLPEFFVPGARIARVEVPVPRGDLRPPEPNLGGELLAIPGVYSHSRAADAMEPLVRGFGFDRIATTLDGIPLVNASPERTNSPVVILGGSAVTGIVVAKVLPSVTRGPPTTGGRIELTTDGSEGLAVNGSAGILSATFNGAREGWSTKVRQSVKAHAWDATVSAFANDLGDYRAADGRRVAARFEDHGESAAVGWTTGTQHVHVAVIHRRLRRQETVSLPLDGKNTEATVATFNYRWSATTDAPLRAIELRAGYGFTDPYITSEDRVSPPISAQATARSCGGGVKATLQTGPANVWRFGGDFSAQRRRAIRTTPAGQDYIWPGARYGDAGLFAELESKLAPDWKLRVGARVDDVRSDANDADRPALGKSIRAQYAAYNGADAAVTTRRDTVGALNVLIEARPNGTLTTFVGAGYTVQPAQVMERYRAFLNALGGDGRGGNAVELGNPALRAERKFAGEAGATFRSAHLDAEATLYWYCVDDFILRTPIGFTAAPLPRMVVFGYRNIDADFCGGEVGANWKPAPGWTMPVTFAIAAARNRRTRSSLSEIPPWEAAVAVRRERPWRQHSLAIETGVRVVGARANPAIEENPLFTHTGSFAVWHARAGVAISPNVRLEVGIENALNRLYTEYLTPPVAPVRPAGGDLLPGDRVPAAGRSWWVSITTRW